MPDYSSITDKQGLVVFGGVTSTTYGMVVAEAPAFDRPKRKFEAVNVPGRNGAVLFQQDAWEDTTRTYKIFISENIVVDSGGSVSGTLPERINNFEAALNDKTGWQTLEDNFEPDTFRLAYFNGGNNFTNEMLFCGESTLSFTCRPERFLSWAAIPVSFLGGGTLVNPTRFTAKPKIRVTGTGTISITVNSKPITIAIPGQYTDKTYYIDCERMDVNDGTNSQNRLVTGTFPTLKPGNNTISKSGSISALYITPRFFTI